jgi:hypothetical protein
MKEVKISYNKQTWHPKEGTYYRGCFTLEMETYLKFTNGENNLWTDHMTGWKCHFINLTGRDHLVDFLKKNNIPFNMNRAYGAGNYYIQVA